MTRKTESLSFPTNPLAAMRELQELDTSPSTDPRPEPYQERDRTTPLPDTHATGSVESSVVSLPERSQVGSDSAKQSANKRPRRETSTAEPPTDPIRVAVKEMLSEPYSTETGRGRQYTVSTVKIPTDVWERLGWVAKFTERKQQDIIADALKDYFQKMLKQL